MKGKGICHNESDTEEKETSRKEFRHQMRSDAFCICSVFAPKLAGSSTLNVLKLPNHSLKIVLIRVPTHV